jgi:hypothetical protein
MPINYSYLPFLERNPGENKTGLLTAKRHLGGA